MLIGSAAPGVVIAPVMRQKVGSCGDAMLDEQVGAGDVVPCAANGSPIDAFANGPAGNTVADVMVVLGSRIFAMSAHDVGFDIFGPSSWA